MSVLLGLRLAFAGGRESLVRVVLTAGGVFVGVAVLLFSFSVLPAIQGRIDRYAWHRTAVDSPATAPDPALWLAVTDRFEGRQLVRVHVAALGPRPPVPPGLARLPGPGEVFVSPALAGLLASVPADRLGDRFPGRVAGVIGPDGLVSSAELVAVVGRTPEDLRATPGAIEIRGIEPPGERVDLGGLVQVMVAMLSVLLVGPVMVFVSLVTRVGAARRERRFAAVRLAGATRWQTGVLASSETGVGAVAGALLGLSGYALALPHLADRVRYEGMPFPRTDVVPPAWQVVLAVVAVPVLAVVTTLVVLRRVQVTPLGVGRQVRRPPPGAWRLAPLAAGVFGVGYIANRTQESDAIDSGISRLLNLAVPVTLLVGLVLAGPWVCRWLSRILARLSRHATTLLAARRIAADPYTAFRAVSGVALATFVATILALLAQGEALGEPADRTVVDPGVVVVQARGTPEAALAPLLSDGVVVGRAGRSGQLIVRCADLATVTSLTCPLTTGPFWPPVGLFDAQGVTDPGPGDETLPVHLLYIPTDGTDVAEERIRTTAARVAPYSLTITTRDWAPPEPFEAGLAHGAGIGMIFVLLVAACSLTVSVVAGLMARKRPFALLRASGVRLGELRLVALLETAVPLVVTVLGGFGVALLVTYLGVPRGSWVWPGPGLFLSLGIGLVVALAVSLVTLPLMDVATRHDSVRYE